MSKPLSIMKEDGSEELSQELADSGPWDSFSPLTLLKFHDANKPIVREMRRISTILKSAEEEPGQMPRRVGKK